MDRPAIRYIITIVCLHLFSLSGLAGDQQFPYQATVVQEQSDVRCGPGSHFYVTGIVRQNEKVTVHRHDHGGWYMIAPPAGSFSWIEASLVQPNGAGRGTVMISPDDGQARRAVVRIGSAVTEDYAFYGRELSHGDEVTILGEKVLATSKGPVKMLKIVPPAQEFRWMKGEALVPLSQQIQQHMAADPYQVPPQHRQRLAAEGRAPIAPSIMESHRLEVVEAESPREMPAPVLKVPATAETLSPVVPVASAQGNLDFARLDEVDQAYQAMIKKDPRNWKLDPIIADYRSLEEKAPAHLQILVQKRLEIAEKRREIAQRYQKFVEVSVATAQRDQELVARQEAFRLAMNQPQGEMLETAGVPESGEIQQMKGEQVARTPQPTSPVELEPTPAPAPFSPPRTESLPNGVVQASHTPAGPATRPLNGAGVLHRLQGPANFPAYALVARDGRLLAYVTPNSGIVLDAWLGKEVGVIGNRGMDPALKKDHIHVSEVLPVQLSR